jgi:hypothetical protein
MNKEEVRAQREAEKSQKKIYGAIKTLMEELDSDAIVLAAGTMAPDVESGRFPLDGVQAISVFGDPDMDPEQWTSVPFVSSLGMMEAAKISLHTEQQRVRQLQESKSKMDELYTTIVLTEGQIAYMVSKDVPNSQDMKVGDQFRYNTEALDAFNAAVAAFAAN